MSARPPVAGLQRERTALAWDRTGLALVVTGLLLVRAGGAPYVGWVQAPGYLAALLGAGLIWHATRRYATRSAGQGSLGAPVLARLTGIAATLVGATAVLHALDQLL